MKKVKKNIKYAQKYGGQDETDSDSSKDIIEGDRPTSHQTDDYKLIQKAISDIALAANPPLHHSREDAHSQAAEMEPSAY